MAQYRIMAGESGWATCCCSNVVKDNARLNRIVGFLLGFQSGIDPVALYPEIVWQEGQREY